MKVKAVYTCDDYYHGLTKGKIYEVSPTVGSDCYDYINDYGNSGSAYKSRFTIIPDTPQIEVGSEWVWVEAKETTTVKYAGDEKVFYKWNTDGSEGCEDIDSFLAHFNPKPKTVTMYFYKDCKGLVHSYSEVMPVFGDYLFTREVEL